MGFDGSKDSGKAVEVAAELAERFEGELTIVHVYSSPRWIYASYAGIPPPDLEQLERAAKEAAVNVLGKGLQISTEHGKKAQGELIEAASVVEALAEFTSHEKTDLVVVGSRGTTGLKRLILGSVSGGLVAHAACPVLVVR